jgi:hypothetical protein
MLALLLFLLFQVCMIIMPWLMGTSLGKGSVVLRWELSPGIAVPCSSPVGCDGPSGFVGVCVLSDCVLLIGGAEGLTFCWCSEFKSIQGD